MSTKKDSPIKKPSIRPLQRAIRPSDLNNDRNKICHRNGHRELSIPKKMSDIGF